MKSLLLLLFAIGCPALAHPTTDTNPVLKKMVDKLNSLKEISYTWTFSSRYFSEGHERDYTTNVYVKFEPASPIGLIFQDESKDYINVYNGSAAFYIDKRKATIELTDKPTAAMFNGKTFLVNSIPTFRKYLPVLMAEKQERVTVSDTTIDGRKYPTARFTLKDTMLHRFGYVTPLDISKNITYTIVIDNDLPYMVVQRDNLNPKDYMSVLFTNMSINTKRPLPETWRYETYMPTYKLVK